jgi:acetyltransferase-like isoleucine patch superfamily enzyme
MRKERLEVDKFGGNPLLHWPEKAGRLRTGLNTLVLAGSKFLPLKLKNTVLRFLGAEIGEGSALGLGVQLDIFYPGKISIGKNTTVGYGTTILTHETTQDEFRTGEVEIGDNVLIGANSTVLPGVRIGDGAKISANSLVNRDVEEDEFVGGVPVERIEE